MITVIDGFQDSNPGILENWIRDSTAEFNYTVEFGAGKFEYTVMISSPVKAGVEIFEPYIIDSLLPVHKVLWDMRDFENANLGKFDCAMFIDSLEHITKDEGIDLINRLKNLPYIKAILIFAPEGNHPQTKDVWGYGNHDGQTHRATWFASDLETIGFDVTLYTSFHKKKDCTSNSAMFAVWRK